MKVESRADGRGASVPAEAQTKEGETVKVESRADEGVALESAQSHQTMEGENIKVESRVHDETLTGELLSDAPVEGVQENGIRVSVKDTEGADGDPTAQIEGVTSVVEKENDGARIGCEVQDDGSRMTPSSSELQQNGKGVGSAHEDVKKIVEGDVSVAVAESGSAIRASRVPQILPEMEIGLNRDVASQLNGGGDDSTTKIEDSGDGVPLVVEIHGSYETYQNSCGVKNTVFKPEGGLLSENGEIPGKNSSGVSVQMVDTEKEEIDEREEQEEVCDQEHEFSVGDLVWGKIKSHPWWPGQIYAPSDASKYAAKCRRRGRLLVAYFGDGTFAWCHPSQLKPFMENFEFMSKQSNSKSFLNAIRESMDEVGRRVELEMTCACVPEEIQNRLARPLAVNAGIKEGVPVPDGGIDELKITRFEPAEFIAHLRDVAEVVSVNSILEHTVLYSRLSALYRAKGYHQLPMFHEADGIASAEDSAVSEGRIEELNLHPAEVEWLSTPVGPGVVVKSFKTSSQKWPGSSDDKSNQRKKQKSMAEILANDFDHQRSESNAAGEVILAKSASTSKRRKSKDYEDDVNEAENSGGTKKMKLTVSLPTGEEKYSDDGEELDEASMMSSSPRLRKKSKYLSPPYTDISRGKSLNSPKDSHIASPRANKVSSVEECIRRDTDQLTGTPPLAWCSGQTFQKKPSKRSGHSHQKKPSKDSGAQRKTYGSLSPRTQTTGDYSVVEGSVFMDDMLSDFLTVALDPFYLKGRHSDTFKSFFSKFRSFVYHTKSISKTDERRGSRKRKPSESIPDSSGEDSIVTDRPSSEPKPKRKRGEMEGPFPRNTQKDLPHVDGTSDMETDHCIGKTKDVSSFEAALLLTFAPGVSLPSKDDLITTFGGFGALNEQETVVLKDSNCARVAFLKSFDAEEAFNGSQKVSPFGQAVVSYRLRYSSSFVGASGLDERSHQHQTPLRVEGNEHPTDPSASRVPTVSEALELDESSQLPSTVHTQGNEPSANPSASSLPPAGEAAPLDFIKQNLERMSSMLENSGEKILPGVKANLEGDFKGLLKKLSTMDDSPSS